MPDLANWDDLVHGTLVFAAAVPFAVALALGLRFPRCLGLAAALSLAGPYLWLFGLPTAPLGSDDALVCALVVGVALAFAPLHRPVKGLAGILLWGLLAWFLYPAWLASDGGLPRRLLVVSSMAGSITAFGLILDRLAADKDGLAPASLTPLAVALAVLLVIGGAAQFAQSSGAIAASMGALCLVILRKGESNGLPSATALGGMLLALLAWCGWLFAEIRPAFAALLFLSPFAALAARRIPLPRQHPVLVLLWDFLAATLAVAPVIAIALTEYLASDAGDSEGY
jgi:hypothetical protein